MAEKEKRIRIEQFEYEEFGHCGGFSTDGDGFYCEFSGESVPITKEICEKKCPYDSSISRQEAIERMAKALAFVQAKTFVDKTQWERVMNGCRYEAEAALNALLEKGEEK